MHRKAAFQWPSWLAVTMLVLLGRSACQSHAPESVPSASRSDHAESGLVRLGFVVLPGGFPGIGFDDLRYSAAIDRVLVPAGRTGSLDLVEPRSLDVRAVSGFSERPSYSGGHDDGVTSADVGIGSIFAADRTSERLSVIDPVSLAVITSVPLAAHPDYVRVVESRRELWVTEPDSDQIEVFTLDGAARHPEHSGTIEVEGGPESLVVDSGHARAYTHLWRGKTVAIDLSSRTLVARWNNGCRASRGIALDAETGLLVVACAEGKVTALDLRSGSIRSHLDVGGGVDVIDFEPRSRHVYVPSGATATLVVAKLSREGVLSEIGHIETAQGAHSAAADDEGKVYVSDPARGRLLVIRDGLAGTGAR